MTSFIGLAGFTSMGKVASAAPRVELPLGSCCFFCQQGQCLQLRLHGINYHRHLFQLCHDCRVGIGKY